MFFILGIDPGASGAISVLDERGRLCNMIDMPTMEVRIGKANKRRVSAQLLAQELDQYRGHVAWVEQVTAMPGQGVSSMFAFGESFGIIKGVLAALYIETSLVTPAKWKKDLALNAGKDGSRAKAVQLWPESAELFKRVKDDGRAEAALIAEYGRRNQF